MHFPQMIRVITFFTDSNGVRTRSFIVNKQFTPTHTECAAHHGVRRLALFVPRLDASINREQYKIGSILGEGAFGQVRLVTNKAESAKYAVKIIEKARIDPGDHSLQTEIDILCRVTQENCVCLKEWFDEPKRVLLIMEFVTGGGEPSQLHAQGRT